MPAKIIYIIVLVFKSDTVQKDNNIRKRRGPKLFE